MSDAIGPQRPSGNHARHEGAMARLARACSRHRLATIVIWAIMAILVIPGIAITLGGSLADEFDIPNSDAQRATDLLEERFPQEAGDQAQVVFAVPAGESLETTQNEAEVEAALVLAGQIDGVTRVGDPYADEGGRISEDGRIAFAEVQFEQEAFEVPLEDIEALQDDLNEQLSDTGIQAEFTGPVIDAAEAPQPFGPPELIGLAVAVLILLFMLGAVVAAALPIGMALVSVATGIFLLLIAADFTTFNTITPVLAVMIGLGVGIDYSLFILTRFRAALSQGMDSTDAAAAAASTAGRAVVFAGVTVAISISALLVIGLDFITKLGLGAAITVVTAVIAAVTLLPAILSALGPRVNKWKVPFITREGSPAADERSFFAKWGRFVTRNATPVLIVTLIVLIVLAAPVAWARLGAADNGTAPAGTTQREAYDLLAEGFGEGFNGPLLVTVDQTDDPNAGNELAQVLAEQEGVAFVPPAIQNESGDTAIVTVFPTSSPQSEATQELVRELRAETIPAALEGSEAEAFVGGNTAAFEDIATQIEDRLPLFMLTVIGIIFVILSMAFRSVVVALKASVTTLLSALAASGVLVAVFQFGWGNEIIGLDQTGPIETFLPPIIFAILFGLAMDYEVFLVSRIREEYVRSGDSRQAIRDGISAIGRVVVAAALIMASVFISFVFEPDRGIKEFGLGLGVAILIDAFIVRMAMVPAIMQLMGDRMWWMPRWLDRILPRITIEAPESDPEDADEDARARDEPAPEAS
jgi:RND superfamily putative drug exporter